MKTDKRRKNEVHLRLSDAEYDRLKRMSDRCLLPKTEYIRRLICGTVPRAAPPLEYNELIALEKELGNQLSEIAETARFTGQLNPQDYALVVDAHFERLSQIERAFVTEDPINHKEALRYGPD